MTNVFYAVCSVGIDNDRADTYLQAIRQEVDKDMPQIVVTIVPTNRKDRYDAIKKLCCLEKPVPSQVIVSRTLSKKQMLMSVCTKIGIQLNCKLGGEAWAVEIPVSSPYFTMFCLCCLQNVMCEWGKM